MAKLFEVPGIVTGSQVLTGEIIPPSVGSGLNTYAGRVVPGAEAVEVGAVPQSVTETVTGKAIPRRYATVDYALAKVGNRYGIKANRNSGYSGAVLPDVDYKTAVFVIQPSNTTAGAATILTMGGFILTKSDANYKIAKGATTVTIPMNLGEVTVIVARADTNALTVYTSTGQTVTASGATAVTTSSGTVTFGTGGFVDAAKDNVVFDGIIYDTLLTEADAQTIIKTLSTVWKGV